MSGHQESIAGDPVLRIAVDLLLEAARLTSDQAGDANQNWEGTDTGHSFSAALWARSDAIRGIAVEAWRLLPPPPASPAVTHQQPE